MLKNNACIFYFCPKRLYNIFMQINYCTISKENILTSIYEEKKSKFLAFIKYVENKAQIDEFLSQLESEHTRARHICFAYKFIENEQIFQKSSDDGEPSGTAGKPILNIIEKNNLINVCIAVVRYFGGVKLGAGNLLRAYSNVSLKAIENKTIKIEFAQRVNFSISYSHYALLLSYLSQNNIAYTMRQNEEDVVFSFDIENSSLENFMTSNNIQFKKWTEKIIKSIE